MISKRCKYGFRALIALARGGNSLRKIAANERIPLRFLEQILRQLKRHGIVQSRRGKLGGFDLLMPANRITFAQILRILDGPLAPLPCLSRNSYRRCADCPNEDTCEVRRVFAKMTDSIREVLECTTIDDAIRAVSGAGSALKDPAARTSIL